MRKQLLKISVFCFTIAIIILLMIVTGKPVFAETNISIGSTASFCFGPEPQADIIKIDVEKMFERSISKHFSWEHGPKSSFFFTNGDLYPGVGYMVGLNYNITDDLKLFAKVGVMYIHDGGDINGLADSLIHEDAEIGIKYKYGILKGGHNSDMFSHADDGDSGLNFIFGGFSFDF